MYPPKLIDPNGNTILHTRSFSLRVSSKSLSLAAPGFAVLFASNPDSVGLYDDDPSALAIIANIFHFKSSPQDVPRGDIYPPLLYELALSCRKYQCIHSLGPWIDIWMNSFDKSKECDDPKYWKEWLVIGEIFEKPDVVAWATKKAAVTASMEDLEKCAAILGDSSNIHGLLKTRNKQISAVFRDSSKFLNTLMSDDYHCAAGSARCEAMVLGSVLKGLVRCGPYPAPSQPYPGVSLDRMIDHLEGMELFVENGHDKCAKVVETMKIKMLEEVRRSVAEEANQTSASTSQASTSMSRASTSGSRENNSHEFQPAALAEAEKWIPPPPAVSVTKKETTTTLKNLPLSVSVPDTSAVPRQIHPSLKADKHYCVCNCTPQGVMIQCTNQEKCSVQWFHMDCVGITVEDADGLDDWKCPLCVKVSSLKPPMEVAKPDMRLAKPAAIPRIRSPVIPRNSETARLLAKIKADEYIPPPPSSTQVNSPPSTAVAPVELSAGSSAISKIPETANEAVGIAIEKKAEVEAQSASAKSNEEIIIKKELKSLQIKDRETESLLEKIKSSERFSPESASSEKTATGPAPELTPLGQAEDPVGPSNTPMAVAETPESVTPQEVELPLSSPPRETDTPTPIRSQVVHQDNANTYEHRNLVAALAREFSLVPPDVIRSIVEKYRGEHENSHKELMLMKERIAHYQSRKHEEAAPIANAAAGAIVETGTFTVGEITKWNPLVKRLKAIFPDAGHDAYLKCIKANDGDYGRALVDMAKHVQLTGGETRPFALPPPNPDDFSAPYKAPEQPISEPVLVVQSLAPITANTVRPRSANSNKPLPTSSLAKEEQKLVNPDPATRSSTPVMRIVADAPKVWTDKQRHAIQEALKQPEIKKTLQKFRKRFTMIDSTTMLNIYYNAGFNSENAKNLLKKEQKKLENETEAKENRGPGEEQLAA